MFWYSSKHWAYSDSYTWFLFENLSSLKIFKHLRLYSLFPWHRYAIYLMLTNKLIPPFIWDSNLGPWRGMWFILFTVTLVLWQWLKIEGCYLSTMWTSMEVFFLRGNYICGQFQIFFVQIFLLISVFYNLWRRSKQLLRGPLGNTNFFYQLLDTLNYLLGIFYSHFDSVAKVLL